MTNGEKYKDVIKRMTRRYPPLHPAVINGKVVPCTGQNCTYCDLNTLPYYGGCNDNYEKWLSEEAEPEKKEEKMEKDKIKVGDTVKVTSKNRMREGATGIVRTINRAKNGTKFYHVHFDGASCLYEYYEHEIEKVKPKKTPPRIVVYRDGDTVTVKDLETGEEASAVCSKKDTFDIHTGAFIAMSRLTHFDTDIRLMRLEMEQLDSYISDIKMRFGALMGEGYKYPDFDEEEV